jgi:hypothetical protein
MTVALLTGCYASWSTAYRLYPRPRYAGLWIDDGFAANLAQLRDRQPEGKPYVWSMAGALSLIDNRFQSPLRWFVVPGSNPPAELARFKKELLSHAIVFLEGGPDHPFYLFQNPDFKDIQLRFREVARLGEFTVCVREP